jgi:hypothetical protein
MKVKLEMREIDRRFPFWDCADSLVGERRSGEFIPFAIEDQFGTGIR